MPSFQSGRPQICPKHAGLSEPRKAHFAARRAVEDAAVRWRACAMASSCNRSGGTT